MAMPTHRSRYSLWFAYQSWSKPSCSISRASSASRALESPCHTPTPNRGAPPLIAPVRHWPQLDKGTRVRSMLTPRLDLRCTPGMGHFARGLRCMHCGAQYALDPLWEGCPACRRDDFVYSLDVQYDEAAQARSASKALFDAPGGVWRFDPLLPVSGSRKITLEEGRTPLVDCPGVAAQANVAR